MTSIRKIPSFESFFLRCLNSNHRDTLIFLDRPALPFALFLPNLFFLSYFEKKPPNFIVLPQKFVYCAKNNTGFICKNS